MGRMVAAVVAGAVTWAVLWIGGNAALAAAFPGIISPDRPLDHVGMLVVLIVLATVLSALAGLVTAAVRGGAAPMGAVWVLAVLQLALGVYFEVSYWSLMPVWYHLTFLALIVPATVWGGTVRRSARGAAAP